MANFEASKPNKEQNKPCIRCLTFLAEDDTKYELNSVIDSGASCNLINYNCPILRAQAFDIIEQKFELSGAFGGSQHIVGKILLRVIIGKNTEMIEFYVVKNAIFSCLLGYPTIVRLNMQIIADKVYCKNKKLVGRMSENSIHLIDTIKNKKTYFVDLANVLEPNSIFFDTNEQLLPILTNKITVEKDTDLKLIHYEDIKTENGLSEIPINENLNQISIESLIEERWNKDMFGLSDEINFRYRTKLKNIILEFSDIFAKTNKDLGSLPRDEKFEYLQEFTVSEPPSVKLYPIDDKKKRIINEEIRKLRDMNILEPIDTNVITSNMLVVPKKGTDELRVVIDLRTVNTVTKPSNLTLPRIDDIMREMSGRKFYLSTDISKAFWSCFVPECQRRWYTVCDPLTRETLAFTRMPMGHRNSAVVFQKIVDSTLGRGLENIFKIYIDDIIGAVDNFDEGLRHLRIIFERLRKFNYKINVKKTVLFSDHLNAFGFHISEKGIRPLNERIDAINCIESPKTRKQIQSTLASFNYYRNHIRNYSQLTSNLYKLTSDKVKFHWNEEHEKDFQALKAAFTNSILLTTPDTSKSYILETDALVNAVGAVLKQWCEKEQVEKIVAINSQVLPQPERLWSISNLELKAVYTGLLKFERLIGHNFIEIRTDNTSVFFTLKSKLDQIEITKRTPALRMLLYISQYNYEVKHVRGISASFLMVDLLSRLNMEDTLDATLALGTNSKQSLLNIRAIKGGEIDANTNKLIAINTIQKGDDVLTKIQPDLPVQEIINGIKLAQLSSKKCINLLKIPGSKYKVKENSIYRITKHGDFIYCPPHYAWNLIKIIHRHESARQTLEKISRLEIWIENKYQIVASYVGHCNICDPARSKAIRDVHSNTIPRPTNPFQTLQIDLMQFGQDIHVLVCVDSFSHFIIAKVLENSNSRSIRDKVLEVITTFGLPQVIVSDNAKNLNSELFKDLYDSLGILHRNSTPYNSRGNSLCELAIRRIQEQTRIYQPPSNELKSYLNIITFKLNTEKRPNKKFSAFEILFHREMSWMRQIPDLSTSKRKTLSKELSQLYNDAEKIRDQVLKEIQSRRSKTILEEKMKNYIKKGDLVRIKKLQKVNEKKKTFHPFSDEIYKVINNNRFTKTVLLQEVVKDVMMQPKMLKVHIRFLSRLRPGPLLDEDDEVDQESLKVITDEKQSVEKTWEKEKLLVDDKSSNKDENVRNKKDNSSNKINGAPAKVHPMSLRKRKF